MVLFERKKLKGVLATFVVVALLFSLFLTVTMTNTKAASPVYGQLKVSGGQLCNSGGQPVQLKGMSSHGLQWYGSFMNSSSIKTLRDNWGANVVRAAMYTAENGYISNPTTMKTKVKEIVQSAIDLGIYVIIDWHILSDGDPNTYKTQAKAFFQEMATTYGSYPNVIYEICNEPNGNATWAGQIKPYAQEVIPVIRAADPDGIVIVGTGTWSQDINAAADSQLTFNNIMYACHFYAGTHGQFLRDRITYAMNKGAAIFVTEWGTSDASGNGGPFLTDAKTWLDFLASKKVSWCNWSLSDKSESSAALMPGASTSGGWTDANLTASGKFVKANMGGGAPINSAVATSTPVRVSTSPVRSTATPVRVSTTPVRATATPVRAVSPTPVQNNTGTGYAASYVIQSSWSGGATINVTIKNNSSTAINGWTLNYTFAGDQKITNSWNAVCSQTGAAVTAKNAAHNANIPANGSVSFGMNISFSGTNIKPASFTLNGSPCAAQ